MCECVCVSVCECVSVCVSVRVTREYPVFCCVVSVGGLLLAGCLPCLPACLPHPSHPVPSQVLPASSVICHHCH